MQHRLPQPYQGAAPLHHQQQQPRTVNSSQTESQHYPVAAVYPQGNLQSPFLGSPAQFPPQQPPENPYYASNPSPRSQHSSAAGSYYPADKPDSMAAATMQRMPPMYHTPQSNSPASVTSPQTQDGRPMYAQPPPQLGQNMYGYQYQPMSQVHSTPGYGHQQNQAPSHGMGTANLLQYQQSAAQLQQGQMQTHHGTVSSSPRQSSQQFKTEPQGYPPQQQSRGAMMQPQQSTPAPPSAGLQPPQQPNAPPGSSNAAPGPIPATTPLVVRQDGNGVQWIAFEYSRDRVKMEYTIRCDVESVDTNNLSQEFKSENCVYPRACVPKEQYKGNRLAYETDCNQVGWALADLNPCLRGKRGLIQRAVDSWRNSNQDPRLRSRRVRRQAKMNNRQKNLNATAAASQPPPPNSAGLPGSSMPAPSTRPPGSMQASSHQLHHHHGPDVSPTGPDSISASPYSAPPQAYRQGSVGQHMGSPNDIRQAHTFPNYQTYPTVPTTMGPSMAPSMHGGMHQLGRPGGPAAMVGKNDHSRHQEDVALFGDLPEDKRRKFILVEDTQKNARVRVKVTLDQIEMSEIPDSYRKQNSVFPRAYYPVQMRSGEEPASGDRFAEDNMEVDDGAPTHGRMSVPIQLGGSELEVDVPKISRSKRDREQKINELGYRMAWGQGRVFSGRPVFLGRALDAYRSKQRGALLAAGSSPDSIPAHLETRPGKSRWLQRQSAINPPIEPPTTSSE